MGRNESKELYEAGRGAIFTVKSSQSRAGILEGATVKI